MTMEDFKLAKHIIDDTLKKEDIENKDGIMSYYDMIKYAENNISDLRDISSPRSSLSRKLNLSSPISLMSRDYLTKIYSLNDSFTNKFVSTIEIYSTISDAIVIINKDKNSSKLKTIASSPYMENLVQKYYDYIIETFNNIEKYSEFFGGIVGKNRCSVDVYGIFFIKTYYNDYGKIYTEIRLNSKYDTEQYFDGINLEKILKENKDNILKKLPLNLNENFKDVGNNHIYLLAQKEYYKEKEKNKQLVKKISK